MSQHDSSNELTGRCIIEYERALSIDVPVHFFFAECVSCRWTSLVPAEVSGCLVTEISGCLSEAIVDSRAV